MSPSAKRLIGLVTLWQIAASVSYYAIFAATPFFRSEFGVSRFLVGLIVTALSLGYAVSLLPVGVATDRFGERRTLTVGLAGLALGSIGVALSWSYWSLLVAVFLVGILYGTAMPGTNKAIFDRIADTHRNLAMGVKQVGVTAGSGLSALLVTGIAGVLVWDAGFYVAGIAAAIVAALFWTLYPAADGDNEATMPSFRALSQNRPYLLLVAAGFFVGAIIFTTTAYTVLYVEEFLGASVATGGAILALVQVTASVGRIVFGWVCDRLPGRQHRRTAAVLVVQILVGTGLLVVVARVNSLFGATLAFGALGAFALGNTGVYYSCLGALVGPDEIGAATGGGQLAITTGGLVVPPVFGLAVDMVGYWAGWSLLAGAGACAAIFVWFVYTSSAAAGSRVDAAHHS